MIIGVTREIKRDEYRVGMTPAGVEVLTQAGHKVLIEREAGLGSGLADAEYAQYGAQIVESPGDIFRRADMVVKVKEPQPEEIAKIQPGQVLFTYFHFAADRQRTKGIVSSGGVAIAYETVRDSAGQMPLLTPISEIAGKMSIQEGAKYLERPMYGRGILLGGVPGVEPATVVIIGGGVVGTNAAKVAAGFGARVIIMDVNIDRLRYLDDVMSANVHTIYSDLYMIRQHISEADLVIGAVLIPGAKSPTLLTKDYLAKMKQGAVIVDVCVDQGGCCETIRPTTHSDPIYEVDGVIHYGVANMPGAVSRTSTFALTNATLPYVVRLANLGYKRAAAADPGLAQGIDVQEGWVTNQAVAETFNMEFRPVELE
ncbi:MAG: alanine dehydrogenase [Planctomycetota bacterium]|nr:MAG: alanine dehydrogenase [Planctomycetota bacterium]